MKNNLKYIIIGIAAVICVSIYVYFSPYHSCMRSLANNYQDKVKTLICVKHKY